MKGGDCISKKNIYIFLKKKGGVHSNYAIVVIMW